MTLMITPSDIVHAALFALAVLILLSAVALSRGGR